MNLLDNEIRLSEYSYPKYKWLQGEIPMIKHAQFSVNCVYTRLFKLSPNVFQTIFFTTRVKLVFKRYIKFLKRLSNSDSIWNNISVDLNRKICLSVYANVLFSPCNNLCSCIPRGGAYRLLVHFSSFSGNLSIRCWNLNIFYVHLKFLSQKEKRITCGIRLNQKSGRKKQDSSANTHWDGTSLLNLKWVTQKFC